MISVPDALAAIDEAIHPLTPGTLPVDDALGAVATDAIEAPISLPPFPQSAMDGFALRAEDLQGAESQSPARLEIVGEVPAGTDAAEMHVEPGEAVRIFTGSPMPDDADTVVRVEKVEQNGETIAVDRPVDRGKDIRPVGEELEAGTRLVDEGQRLREGHLSVLSMVGFPNVEVRPVPNVALFVSGDEVVAPGQERGAAEVYDANTPFLTNWMRRHLGVEPETMTLPDDLATTRQQLEEARESADLIVSTGGVSMGDYDFLGDAADELGARDGFWKIAQKPAKPVYFAMLDETPFLGLPGNPGAVFVATHIYLRRAVDALQQTDEPGPGPTFRGGRLEASVRPSSSRHRWIGCRVEDETSTTRIEPVPGHRLGAVYDVDGLMRIPPGDDPLAEGDEVRWTSIDPTS